MLIQLSIVGGSQVLVETGAIQSAVPNATTGGSTITFTDNQSMEVNETLQQMSMRQAYVMQRRSSKT